MQDLYPCPTVVKRPDSLEECFATFHLEIAMILEN